MNYDNAVFFVAPVVENTHNVTCSVGVREAIDELKRREIFGEECRITDRHDNEYVIYDDYSSGELKPNLMKV